MTNRKTKRTSLKEKYIATLIGCGIGDTLGMPVEGLKKSKIKERVGRITEPIDSLSPYTKGYKKGQVTDDTVLTLAIAESIAEQKGLKLKDVTNKQIEAYIKHGNRGFGTSTRKAFGKIMKGTSPLKSAVEPGLGSGPPMKTSSIGLYMHRRNIQLHLCLEFARKVGESTHKDERAIAAGIVQAYAIPLLLDNASKKDFLDSLVFCSREYEYPFNEKYLPEKGNLTDRLNWITKNQDSSEEKAYNKFGNLCPAIECYPFTIFMFQKYWDKPLEGLIETVNWGGDCDTTGAMYGALAGAKNGMIFPKSWVNVLQDKEKLINAAERIYNLKPRGIKRKND